MNTAADNAPATPGSTTCNDTASTCSLRAAIDAANSDTANVDQVVIPAAMTILLDGAKGELAVTNNMWITGGAGTVIDGQSGTRVFNLGKSTTNPAVAISNLTVQNGGTGSGDGGGIYAEYAGVTLTNVLVKGGSASSGGGVYSDYYATLWLVNSVVDSNTASSEGGGLYLDGSAFITGSTVSNNTAPGEYGGGIYISSGQVTVQNTQVSGNKAYDGGGIYNDETLRMVGGSLDHNTADSGGGSAYGAAIDGETSTSLTGVSITDNKATGDYIEGGAIYNGGSFSLIDSTIARTTATATASSDIYGGVISNDGENFTMQGGSITDTATGVAGTAVYIYGGVVYMDYPTTFAGVSIANTTTNADAHETEGGVFYIEGGALNVASTTVANTTNSADTIYGGVFYLDENASISMVSVRQTTNNFGSYLEGGVLYNNYYLTLDHLTVDATTGSSPLSASDGQFYGGVIANDGDNSTMRWVTVTNTTMSATGATSYGEGGVFYNDYPVTVDWFQALDTKVTVDDEVYGGVFSNDGDHTTLTNSTFARATTTVTGANSATHKYAYGGAAYLEYGTNMVNVTFSDVATSVPAVPGYDTSTIDLDDNMNFTNVTVANNTITGATDPTKMHSGIWYDAKGYTASFKNTIVSNQPATNECGVDPTGLASQFISTGHNLDNGTTCGFVNVGDLQNANAKVMTAADNGGAVQTAALAPGSQAIDAATMNGAPATDARGVTRPQGPAPDMGAFEVDAQGYLMSASDGGIFAFGHAQFMGSLGSIRLNSPIVSMVRNPNGPGYWLVAADGGVFAFGVPFFGSAAGRVLSAPIVGIASTATGHGYWLAGADGRVYPFGDALFFGDMGSVRLTLPIVGIAATPDGLGYWLVAKDGGIFAFGDATFHGSTGAIRLNQPIVAMTPTRDGMGYWLVASDGGIFAYGDAGFFGSAGSIRLNRPVVAMGTSPSGHGYWLFANDGGVFSFGDAQFLGSLGALHLNQPVNAGSAA